ncbi:MAG TPA: hypothetical protein VFQ44_02560 [Streptosporangiaceae bacterium]|nr:hypothetical protein [Streptosporangiaceae bacterium]
MKPWRDWTVKKTFSKGKWSGKAPAQCLAAILRPAVFGEMRPKILTLAGDDAIMKL